jgi:fatty acid amide hydrolase
MFSLCCLPSPLTIAVTAIAGWIILKIILRAKDMYEVNTLIQRKQAEREAGFGKLETQYGEVKPEHEQILALSDENLLRDLQERRLTAVQVLDAFIAKAFEIQKKHNCIVQFIPEAKEWAKELDALKEVKGPFHGLPISIKDNCGIKGLDSTLGLGKRCFIPAQDHSVIVKVLLDLGAVPFCKTNVPQTLISFGCANPVFGVTTNFLNDKLSPGGSSGGEATLIAGGGSILGIGSDIGGSVRIPAHFSGIFGFKGTKDRLSGLGYQASIPNIVGVAGVPGLLSKSLDTLIDCFRLLVDEKRQNKYDPVALPLPWNKELFNTKRKLRIGYYTNLSYYPLVGDTEATVLEAKSALEADGHTLVPFEMPDSFEMMKLVVDLCFADHGSHLSNSWKGEPIPLAMLTNFILYNSPMWFRKLAASIVEQPIPFIHTKRAATFFRGGSGNSKDLWTRLGDRKKMIEDLTNQWKKLNLDLLLCPSFPFPAVATNLTGRLQSAVVYTMIWNLFDFPAGCVKWGSESGRNVDAYDDQSDFMMMKAATAARQAVGMPISVQIVGLPYQDEFVLRGMKEVEKVARMRDVNAN